MAATTLNQEPPGAAPTTGERPIAPPSPNPWLIVDLLSIAAAVIIAAVFFFLYPDARQWTYQALGYGWAPAALWLTSVIIILRYRPRFLSRHWKPWAIAAAAAALSIAALSYFAPTDGPLEDVSYAGRWGLTLGGPTLLPYGALKLAALIAILPLILYPRPAGRLYYRAARRAGQTLAAIAVRLYRALRPAAAFLGRPITRFNQSLARRRAQKAQARAAAPSSPATPRRPLHDDPPRDFNRQVFANQDNAPPSGNAAPGDDIWSAAVTSPPPNPDNPESPDPVPSKVSYDNGYVPPWLRPAPAAAAPSAGPGWRLPAAEMLAPPESLDASQDALREMGRLVEETLADHGVRVEVTDVKAGPRVVQFGLSPGWVAKGKDGAGERSRVKVQSIITREKDLALALKTPYLRMESPMIGSGAGLVGIEVPNPTPSKVHLRAIMETPDFRKIDAKGGLPIAMGQNTSGAPVSLDLASLPHMLIAGSTGSGKSVQINSIIASFLLTRTPEQLRLLMVDPKRVELTPYNGIPHLIQPVIVEPDDVTDALRGLNREMIRRYKQMEDLGVRNIAGYNSRADQPMPFLVLIVDELADLMMAAGFEVEQNLVRLAQLGRAAGIHLLLATQRPSVNVVTGLLKANIPARCAFAVSGQVDSRVILDASGAEKLMGKGDSLILHKESPKAQRMQGALVYDEEVETLVNFWKDQDGPPVPPINLLDDESDTDPESDPLNLDLQQMDQARDLAARNPNLSANLLERRLKIGNKRAAEILDTLEQEGALTPR